MDQMETSLIDREASKPQQRRTAGSSELEPNLKKQNKLDNVNDNQFFFF